jgi:hypothetical protein
LSIGFWNCTHSAFFSSFYQYFLCSFNVHFHPECIENIIVYIETTTIKHKHYRITKLKIDLFLKFSLWKFYGRNHDLVYCYGVSVSQIIHDYVTFVIITIRSFPYLWHFTGFVNRITGRVPLVVQELHILLECLRLPPGVSGLLFSV